MTSPSPTPQVIRSFTLFSFREQKLFTCAIVSFLIFPKIIDIWILVLNSASRSAFWRSDGCWVASHREILKLLPWVSVCKRNRASWGLRRYTAPSSTAIMVSFLVSVLNLIDMIPVTNTFGSSFRFFSQTVLRSRSVGQFAFFHVLGSSLLIPFER